MKAFKKVSILILVLTIAAPAMAQTNGSDLISLWKSYKKSEASKPTQEDINNSFHFMGYVQGVRDALLTSDNELRAARPKSLTLGQACAIVGKYLDEHPEEWDLFGNVIVHKALRAAFIKK